MLLLYVYITHIVRAVRVRLTSGPSISLRQLVWTDVLQQYLLPIT